MEHPSLLEQLGICTVCSSENVSRITAKYPDGKPDKVFKYCMKCHAWVELGEPVTEINKEILKKVEIPLLRAQRRARAGSSKKGVGNANKSRK